MRPLSKPAGTFGISIAARLTRPDAAGVDPGTHGSRGDGALILIFVVDLALATRHGPHVISVGPATRWIVFYVVLAVAFGIGLSVVAGGQLGGEFFAGYLTEYSLSIDNLFGAFLIYTAIQLARHRDKPPEIGSNPLVTALERILPTTRQYDGAKVVTRVEGKKVVTPVLLVMIAIGSADLLFALDSIPAIFGLTKEPYIVFTANAFALLGLRQLYFLLNGILGRLVYLSIGLSVILGFIGVKLIVEAAHLTISESFPEFSIPVSLGIIISVLVVTTVASLLKTARDPSAIKKMPRDG